jgi:alkylation response protein AidB-like acyl-CoA dehydrogenase
MGATSTLANRQKEVSMAVALDFNVESDELVARAAELRPLLTGNAERVENDRRLTDENIQALEESGLIRAVVPQRWGGAGVGMTTMVRLSVELAKGCPSTSWIHTIYSLGSWVATLLPDEGQEELFADGVPRSIGVATPPGAATARPVDGGYVLSGSWGFASGAPHAQWAGVWMVPVEGRPPEEAISAYMPASDFIVEDTWFVAGMAGTGSNHIVVNEAFVPHRRILPPQFMAGVETPGRRYGGAASDSWTLLPVLLLPAIGVFVGASTAVRELVSEGAGKRAITYTTFERQLDSHVVIRDIAEATLKIEAAELMMLRAAEETDRCAAQRQPMDIAERARIRGEAGFAGQLTRDAVDRLLSISGASSFAKSNPVQRYWRDLNTLSRHAFLTPNPCLETFGRSLLGVEPNISLLI